jgi:predicted phage tail protein
MTTENVYNLTNPPSGSYDLINDSDSPQETHSIAKFLDVWCEGPIYGFPTPDIAKHIYLDGNSLSNSRETANIDHTNFEYRIGSGTQTPMSGDMQVLGTELAYGGAANTIKTDTSASQDILIRDTNGGLRVEAVKITLNFPTGIYGRNPSGEDIGKIELASLVISVDIYPNPISNPTEKIRRVQHLIAGGRTGQFEADIVIEMPGHWLGGAGHLFCESTVKFEVTKTSDYDENYGVVGGDQVYFLDCHWVRYAKLTRGLYRYPYTAYIGMQVDSRYFSQVPQRTYDLKLMLIKLPSNYKPAGREYTGVWDGSFYNGVYWSDNPAWCYYDLITNPRYGLGEYLKPEQIDKWALYKIGKYCDELVYKGTGDINDQANWEPRYTCNILIRDREEAFNVIMTMTSIFRGMAYWNGSTLTATQEAPSPVVAHYNNSNVINGDFSYSGSSMKVRHTAALVKYLEPDSGYEERVEYVEDREGIQLFGYREKEITAAGCTSRSTAHRIGRWLLLSEKEETEIVSFSTGLQGVTAPPGSIISINDMAKSQDRIGGRVQSATANTLTFDSPIYINPNLNWVLAIVTDIRQREQLPDGTWQD